MSTGQQYPKGTLAIAKGVGRVLSIGNGWFSESGEYQFTSHLKDIRPLVVLALDDPQGVVRSLDLAMHGNLGYSTSVMENLAHQIEQQIRPPKPDEPQAFGAKVTARVPGTGRLRLLQDVPNPGPRTRSWVSENNGRYDWSDLTDVTLGWDDEGSGT